MKKAELIESFAEAMSITKTGADETLERLGTIIATELEQGGEVPLPGLGKLVVVGRAARKGRNPKTGAVIDVAAKRVVIFRPGKDFKAALND